MEEVFHIPFFRQPGRQIQIQKAKRSWMLSTGTSNFSSLLHMEIQTPTLHKEKKAFLFNFLNFVFLFYPITFRRNTAVRDYKTIKIKSFITRFLILSPLLFWYITSAHSGTLVECTQYNGSYLVMTRFAIHDQ